MVRHLVTYQSEQIEEIWPQLEPLILKVFRKVEDRYSLQSIKDSLLKKELQLWTCYNGQLEAFCLTHIAIYPNYKILEIFMAAGINSREWVPFMANVESWAREIGCKSIRVNGRKGWIRKLPDFQVKQYILEKRL